MTIEYTEPKEPWLNRYNIFTENFEDLLLIVTYLIARESSAFRYSVIFGERNFIQVDCNCLIIEELLEEFENDLKPKYN